MLMLICPCGHSAILPENSARLICSECKRTHVFELFPGPDCIERWRAQSQAVTFRIEWRAAAEAVRS